MTPITPKILNPKIIFLFSTTRAMVRSESEMPQRVERWNRSYENIELSCDYARCAPCTYPNCQRYVRVKKTAKKAFAK